MDEIARVRVVWANLFLVEFLTIVRQAGVAVKRWYWTDSVVRSPERGQLDAIVEMKV